jgi:hypothetical protein
MRPIRSVAVPASSNSAVVVLDPLQKGPILVQLAAITGTPAITVQWTNDDVQAAGYDPATGAWKACGQPGSMAAKGDGGVLTDAQTVPKEIMPVAIRFVNANGASTGSMNIMQSGILG